MPIKATLSTLFAILSTKYTTSQGTYHFTRRTVYYTFWGCLLPRNGYDPG